MVQITGIPLWEVLESLTHLPSLFDWNGTRDGRDSMTPDYVWGRDLNFRSIFLLALFVLLVMYPLVPSNSYATDVSFNTGLNYYYWESTKREKGQQFYIPVSIEADIKDFSFRVLTGYMYNYYDNQGVGSHDTDDVLDTKVNLSYYAEDVLGIDVLVGLDFNIPTGRTNLSDDDIDALMDPDLVPITSWGEGFDVNPTVTLIKSWDKIVVGVSGGFLWRDSYDYSKEFENYDPGDIWRVTGEFRYYPSDNWFLRLYSSYTWYEEDEVDGNDFYEPGDMLEFGAGILYDRSPWRFKLDLSSYFRDKDRIETTAGNIRKEDHNSYGDEFLLTSNLRYDLNDRHAVFGLLNLMRIEPNGYSHEDRYYKGRRQKAEVGLGWQWRFAEKYRLQLLSSVYIMHDEETALHPDSNRTYRGASIRLGVTTHF